MKMHSSTLLSMLLSAAMLSFTACKQELEPSDNPNDNTEQRDDETPSDENGNENGNETPGGGSGENQGGGSTMGGLDVFKAFDQVGNSFWYQWTSSSSYVAYGGGRQSSSDRKCISWEVTDVSGNTATVAQYENIDFTSPVYLTFKRGNDGSLFMGEKQITNTQSPEFYCITMSRSGNYEWKETFDGSKYTNIFYTKSNGYTTTKTSYDISETWNEFGLSGSKFSSMADDASVGSYSKNQVLKVATTAYNQYGSNDAPPSITVTKIGFYEYNSVDDYVQEHPGANRYKVWFTFPGTNEKAWGVCIGIYLNDGNGGALCYPCYEVSDLTTYVKSIGYSGFGRYTKVVAEDKLIDSKYGFKGDNSEYIYEFYLTQEGSKLVESSGGVSFGLFALGYGYISEVTPASSFTIIPPSSSSAPMRVSRNMNSVNGQPVQSTPSRRLSSSELRTRSVR